jgi:amidohydrolase
MFSARFKGRGGHAAYPHTTADPIVAAAQFITAAQTVVSRNADPFEAAVVSVTHVDAGATWNVIPGEAFVEGTLRSPITKRLEEIAERVGVVAKGVAAASGITVDYKWNCATVAVNNDAALADFVAEIARGLGLTVRPAVPALGGEDFARYQEHIPGLFWRIGVASPQALHHPGFVADLTPLTEGAELLAAVARAALAKKA